MSQPRDARAIVLLSGGLDSSTCLALAQQEGLDCSCLTIQYGQRHEAELHAARRVAKALGVSDHRFVRVDLGSFGGSALTSDIPIPKDNNPPDKAGLGEASMAEGTQGIPVTYVPARNTVFLSLALAFAEVEQAQEIWIGVNAVDYSGYPDCRPEFIAAFENLAMLATKIGVEEGKAPRIVTPLIDLSKADIIQRGMAAGLDYSITLTCYDPDEQGRACAHCEACTLRRRGFLEAHIPDPTLYRADQF